MDVSVSIFRFMLPLAKSNLEVLQVYKVYAKSQAEYFEVYFHIYIYCKQSVPI